MQEVLDAISTVGFPIICFLLCGWYVKYREDKNDAQMEKLISVHSAEISAITEAVNLNTVALQKLSDSIEDLSRKERS
ncbi:MAG: hypothetical protein J6Q80_07660 [Lentisphaeria bacterium]|nr:hypothetical protein [Lentisphaeria bacterium]